VAHDKPEHTSSLTADVQDLEATLRILWEKSKKAAETIRSLREENAALQERIGKLDMKILQLGTELRGKDDEMKQLVAELQSNNGGIGNFSDAEKEEFKQKIILLLNKINSHL
jgi:chromosome segregation ATPase